VEYSAELQRFRKRKARPMPIPPPSIPIVLVEIEFITAVALPPAKQSSYGLPKSCPKTDSWGRAWYRVFAEQRFVDGSVVPFKHPHSLSDSLPIRMESSAPTADEALFVCYRVQRAAEVADFEVPLGVAEPIRTPVVPFHLRISFRALIGTASLSLNILPVVLTIRNAALRERVASASTQADL